MEDLTSFKNLVEEGVIKNLPEIEKTKYVTFYLNLFNEDIELCKKLINTSSRWSIICGYYAMHNIAKAVLAKLFNIKISGKFVHQATIIALKRFKDEINKIIGGKCNIDELLDYLEIAKNKRASSQYYRKNIGEYEKNEAYDFLKTIVEPFINL